MADDDEKKPLNPSSEGGPPQPSYTVPLKSEGVKPSLASTGIYHPEDERLVRGRSGSLHVMSENVDLLIKPQGKSSAGHARAASHGNLTPIGPGSGGIGKMPPRSYSVSGDGQVSYLTPLQMGRAELYEMVPFMAVPGLQKKERNLSRAFASYAAEIDVLEVRTGTWIRS